MNKRFPGFLYILLTLGGMMLISAGTTQPIAQPMNTRFCIEEKSRLYLQGTTNVNNFTCDCEDRFTPQNMEVQSSGTKASFRNARLTLTTKRFNCHNTKMDQDMQKALKADAYPYIRVELVETRQDPENLKPDNRNWFDVKAKVKITITNITREYPIQARAQHVSENRFRLQGAQSVLMTNFGIDPPTALFGLIEVNDQIDFHFDLYVRIEQD